MAAPSLKPHNIDENAIMRVYLLVWGSFSSANEAKSGSGHWALYFDASDPHSQLDSSKFDTVHGKLQISKFYGLIVHLGASKKHKMVFFVDETWIGPAPEGANLDSVHFLGEIRNVFRHTTSLDWVLELRGSASKCYYQMLEDIYGNDVPTAETSKGIARGNWNANLNCHTFASTFARRCNLAFNIEDPSKNHPLLTDCLLSLISFTARMKASSGS
jgi:hypothetical protein